MVKVKHANHVVIKRMCVSYKLKVTDATTSQPTEAQERVSPPLGKHIIQRARRKYHKMRAPLDKPHHKQSIAKIRRGRKRDRNVGVFSPVNQHGSNTKMLSVESEGGVIQIYKY